MGGCLLSGGGLSPVCGHVPWSKKMEQGAVFQSKRSQAIRLPKAVALPDKVTRVDIVRIITPAGES